jgi:formate dehydrogenase subunit delta
MRHDDLVRMVNQICVFFDPYPEGEAVAGVTEHLQKFWDPSMRNDLLRARQELAQRLHPLAMKALERLAAEAKA